MNVPQKASWRPLQPIMALEDCPVCGGTGWETLEVRGVHTAKRCGCSLLSRTLRIREGLCVPPRYQGCTLAGFEPKTLSQHHALKAAQRFVDQFPRVPKGLFLSGPPGVGKTHLTVGILLALAARFHEDLLFVDFPSFLESARSCSAARLAQLPQSGAANASLVLFDNFGCCVASSENLRFTEGLLGYRSANKRVSLFTGEQIYCSGAFRPSRNRHDSASDRFIRQLRSPARISLLTSNRLLPVSGEDFRAEGAGRMALFL